MNFNFCGIVKTYQLLFQMSIRNKIYSLSNDEGTKTKIKACAKTVFIGFGILFQASFPLFAISRITSTIESRDMSVCSTPPLKTACLTAEDTTSSIPVQDESANALLLFLHHVCNFLHVHLLRSY